MSLEFPCPKCQHLLRTADDKAGLSATCPACGESIWVPYPHQINAPAPELQPPEIEEVPSADRYELEDDDPFADESIVDSRPGDAVVASDGEVWSARQQTPAPDAPSTAHVTRAGVVTCDHCGTENDAGSPTCRACAADLPPPADVDDGWRPRDPDMGEILQSAWAIYTSEMGLLIGGWLLYAMLAVGALVCSLIPFGIVMAVFAAADSELIVLGVLGGLVLALPFVLLGLAVVNIGFVHFCFNIARGTSGGVGDLFYAFGGGRALIPGAVLVALVSFLLNFFTCGLAAILVWPLWYAEVYRRASGREALGEGFGIIQREFVTVLLVGLIVYGISFAVSAVPYIGIVFLVFAMPFLEMLHAVAYLRMERDRIVVDRGE